MIFHLHAQTHNELFHTGHKKILDSEGLFFVFCFLNHAQEKTWRLRRFLKTKTFLYPMNDELREWTS